MTGMKEIIIKYRKKKILQALLWGVTVLSGEEAGTVIAASFELKTDSGSRLNPGR